MGTNIYKSPDKYKLFIADRIHTANHYKVKLTSSSNDDEVISVQWIKGTDGKFN